MMYCTKCGSDLKGSRVRCPICGYEVLKMKMDVSKPRETRKIESEPRAWAPPIPDQRGVRRARPRDEPLREPEPEPVRALELKTEEVQEEEDPRYVDGCSICGSNPVHRCFFTLAPLCQRHTVYMQIFIRNMAFGERVPSSPEIASAKEGRPPTKAEAEDAGMFFAIKPYHEWKRVRG